MAKSDKVVLGILAGIAIGAALGILFAPDKGSETRRKLAEKAEDLSDGLEGQFDDFMQNLKKKYAEVKDHVDEKIAEQKQNTNNDQQKVTPAP